jgi:type VI secretion system secreted protein VgrG
MASTGAAMAAGRRVSVKTPLGPQALRFRSLTATEALSQPYDFEVELESADGSVDFDQVLGRELVVELPIGGGGTRYFHGLVAGLAQSSGESTWTYQAHVVPQIWFLQHTSDCRVFQNESIPDIVKSVLRDHGVTEIEVALAGSYDPVEYCVQYRETDLNFVHRLLEQEGIYYYFKHEASRHVLVLADGASSHGPVAGYDKVPFFPPSQNVVRTGDYYSVWASRHAVMTGKYAVNSYDFEKPRGKLLSSSAQPGKHPLSSLE